MLSREAFTEKLLPLRAVLEARRRHYRRYFYLGCVVALLLIPPSWFVPFTVLGAVQSLFGMHTLLKSSDAAALRLFGLALAGMFVLAPVFNYRGEKGFSIEQAMLDRLLSFCGPLVALPPGSITGADFRRTQLSPGLLNIATGQAAAGTIGDMRVRLCALSCFGRGRAEAGRLLFKGLAVWSERLDGGYDNLVPPAIAREAIEALANAFKNTRKKNPLWDERLAAYAAACYSYAKESILERVGKNELPSERSYRLQYETSAGFSWQDAPRETDAHYEPYALECNPRGALVLIPGPSAIFQLGSLFATPFTPETEDRFYRLMCLAEALSQPPAR